MRKLLVASQKGGVGKTTTTLNLAAAASLTGRRVLILDSDPIGSVAVSLGLETEGVAHSAAQDLGLAGHLWEGAMPATDVLNPYSSPQFAEEDLGQCLNRLDRLARRRGYDLILLDAPPSLWQRSRLLLGAAQEVLLVLRVEPLAYRTLPGFLGMLKSSGTGCRLTGILLTLAAGQQPGDPLEQEMTQRLGKRLIPPAIPYDPAAAEALLAGMPMVSHRPDSEAARAYIAAAHRLGLIDSIEEFQRGLVRRPAAPRSAPEVAEVSTVPFPRPARPEPGTEGESAVALLDPSLPFNDQHERVRPTYGSEWLPWVATSTLLGVMGAFALRFLAR